MDYYLGVLLKIVAATILGGLVGLEREHHNQPAGLKTHIILCVGAALITIVSIDLAKEFAGTHPTDPTRIAANIVTGIGFLGGGAILRMGATVRGLTTAACIWTVTGVGMAVGAGYYFPGALVILTILLTLHYLGRFENVLLNRRKLKKIAISARSSPDILGSIERILLEHEIIIKNVDVSRELNDPNVEIQTLVSMPERININKLTDEIFQIPGTTHFEVE